MSTKIHEPVFKKDHQTELEIKVQEFYEQQIMMVGLDKILR